MSLEQVIVPVVVAVILSIGSSIAISRYSGPAQNAYIAALQGRLNVVSQERDEAMSEIPKLEARIRSLESRVHELQKGVTDRDREIAALYRRLDSDELEQRRSDEREKRRSDS